MFQNTRTTFAGRVLRFITWNASYHVEHHAYPSVPFHKLPDLHDNMQPHLKHTAEGYGPFLRDYAVELPLHR